MNKLCNQNNNACVGITRGYRVVYAAVNELGEALEDTRKVVDIGNSSTTEAVVGGLQPDSIYQFAVSAYTRKSDGERTRHRRVKTHGAGSRSTRTVVTQYYYFYCIIIYRSMQGKLQCRISRFYVHPPV